MKGLGLVHEHVGLTLISPNTADMQGSIAAKETGVRFDASSGPPVTTTGESIPMGSVLWEGMRQLTAGLNRQCSADSCRLYKVKGVSSSMVGTMRAVLHSGYLIEECAVLPHSVQ